MTVCIPLDLSRPAPTVAPAQQTPIDHENLKNVVCCKTRVRYSSTTACSSRRSTARGLKLRLSALALCLLIPCVGLGGCASIVRGSEEPITFQSEPAEAAVSLSNGLSCPSTPCEMKVARKDDFTATFTKPGYEPTSLRVVSHVSGTGAAVGAGNILAGGVIGIGVDAYNGANLDHEPNPVAVKLAPVPVPPREVVSERKQRKRRGKVVS